MTFQFDTGPTPIDAFQGVPDWFRDLMPADAAPEKVMHDYGYHLIGEIKEPKTFKTVRKRILAHWSFLQRLAETHPDVFDELLAAYGERWTEDT